MISAVKEKAFLVLTRLFLPSLAKNMEAEGTFKVFEGDSAISDENEYFRIYDNGADVTLFIFSGMDVLFAGEPRFEFRKQLENIGHPVNFVFIRELRRTAYHISPRGTHDGLEYYTRKVNELKEQLGGRINIGMGASGGGSAAFYFGSRCGFDHMIGFSPAFPETVWTGPIPQLKAVLDISLLLTRPLDYVEVVLVALAANVIAHTIRRSVPDNNFWDVYERYLEASTRSTGTIIYGKRCRPDAHQAELVKHIPGMKLVPINTGRHNCPGFLKEGGQLADTLSEEIRCVLRRLGVPLATPMPNAAEHVALHAEPMAAVK